jgi:hypothetical protein
MAAKALTTDEMIGVSNGLVEEGQSPREAAKKVPAAAALLPRIAKVHAGVLAVLPEPENPRLAEIKSESSAVDLRHDNIIRGGHGLLTSLALLTADADRAAEYIELRDFLFPDGLESIQKSYSAEAGQAERLKKRLTPARKRQLKAIAASDASLLAYVNELLAKGKRLGELEAERATIEEAPAEGESAAQATVTARNRWIRAMNAFVSVVEDAELDPKVEAAILAGYRAAERKAATRKGPAQPAADDDAEATEPDPKPAKGDK